MSHVAVTENMCCK